MSLKVSWKKKATRKCTSSLYIPGPRFKQVRHKSATSLNYYPSVSLSPFILNNQLSFPRHRVNGAKSFFVQEARGFERSSQHGNTFYPLSLSLVASTVFFSPTCERLASFHGLYLSSRIISFVSLLRQPFPNRTTTSNPSYLPYR